VKPTPLLFAGIFASFAAAWLGLIVSADNQIGHLLPEVDEENATSYPINVAGITEQGRRAYIANGCNYCHTQMVRDRQHGADLAREWGTRRTVPRDYIYTNAAVLGVMRNGPDLSNVGAAGKAEDSKRKYLADPAWHYAHLYHPQALVENSSMPPYRYLFKKRKIVGESAYDALDLTGDDAPEEGYEIVPTDEARALVAYLLSLDRNHPLSETAGPAPAAAAAPAK